jgi:NAD(P)-dependent dehydrogenase (short-subunit alcohol dehydrogenase family)
MSSGILQDKIAIVFGAGGSIGSAAGKEFAAEGAQLFLAGRTQSHVEDVTRQIAAGGGRAEAATVNALDDAAVNGYLDRIVSRTGRIDAVFNATGPLAREYGNGKYAVNLKIEEFTIPLTTVVKSQFITARAAARHMMKQHSRSDYFSDWEPSAGSRARHYSHRGGLRCH